MDNPEITHLSLCAGIAGLDEGLDRAIGRLGFSLRTVAYAEIEAWPCANLVAKMENGTLDPAPIWTDLLTFPGATFHGKVCVVSGGFSCQPFSSAGRGAADADPRHLFPAITTVLRDTGAPIGLFENVDGIISARLRMEGWNDPVGTPVLLHVLRELERGGFRAAWTLCSAEEVGAPHRRLRVFIMAHRDYQREQQPDGLLGEVGGRTGDGGESMADRIRARLEGFIRDEIDGCKPGRIGTDTARPAPETRFWPSSPGSEQFIFEPPRVLVGNTESGDGQRKASRKSGHAAQPDEGRERVVGDSDSEGLLSSSQPGIRCGKESTGPRDAESVGRCGDRESDAEHMVDASEFDGQRRSKGTGWRERESQVGAPGSAHAAPWEPAIKSAVGVLPDGLPDWSRLAQLSGLSPQELAEISEWMCRTDNRTDELRALGNSVIPATAEQAILLLMSQLIGIYQP